MSAAVLQGLASSGLNTAGSLLGSAFQQMFYGKNLDKNLLAQKDLMKYQNVINQKNLLNEMKLKKQAYINAGLSTAALVDGRTGLVGQSMPSSPSSYAPNVDLGGLGSAGASVMLMASQARKNNADARAQEITNTYQDDMMQKTLSQLDENIGYIRSQKDINDVTKERAIADLEYYKQAYPEILNQLQLTNNELDARISNLNVQYKLSNQQYDFNSQSMPLQLKMAIAQISLMHKQGKLYDAQAKQCFATIGELNQLARLYGSQANVSQMTESAQIAKAVAEKGKVEGEQVHIFNLAEQTSQEIEKMRRNQGKYGDMKSPIEKYEWCMDQLGKFTSALGPIGGAAAGYVVGKGKLGGSTTPSPVAMPANTSITGGL